MVVRKSVTRGADGLDCLRVQPLNTAIGYTPPAPGATCIEPSFPSGNFVVLSVMDGPVTGTGSIVAVPGKGQSGLRLHVDPNLSFASGNQGPATMRTILPDTRTDFTEPVPIGSTV
ncbi:MAG: hypothetical protein R2882_14325 [Gemmatimonadales bacterium]